MSQEAKRTNISRIPEALTFKYKYTIKLMVLDVNILRKRQVLFIKNML